MGFNPDVFRVAACTFKPALAQVRSSLNYPDKPHWFTARRTMRAVGDKYHWGQGTVSAGHGRLP